MALQDFEILKDCRSYLYKFNLCVSTNKRLCNIPIPFALMNLLSVSPFLLTIFRLLRFCVLAHFKLSEIENGFAILLGVGQLALIYVALALERPNIVKVVEQIQSVVTERCRMSTEAHQIYLEAEENNVKEIKKIRKFIVIGLLVCYFPASLVPLSYLIVGSPKQEEWNLPFPDGVADEHTFSGYYITLFYHFFGGTWYMTVFGVVLSMEIGFCEFVYVCSNDLKQIFSSFTENDLNDKSGMKLKEAIDLHQETLKIGRLLQIILAGSLFFQMLICAMFLAFMLLSIDGVREHAEGILVTNLFSLMLEILLNYTSCNCAHTLTDRFSDIADDFYNSILWHKLPCKQQRMIVMSIHRAQIPVPFKGYSLFNCNMETFLAMIRASFSYFVMLNQFKSPS